MDVEFEQPPNAAPSPPNVNPRSSLTEAQAQAIFQKLNGRKVPVLFILKYPVVIRKACRTHKI